jgi:hypothetical protein
LVARQRRLHDATLDAVASGRQRYQTEGSGATLQLQVMCGDQWPVAHHHATLQAVEEFADVAGPLMSLHGFERIIGKAMHPGRFAGALGVEKILRKR